MTYTHLTTNELVMIEAYYQENTKVSDIVTSLGRSKQTIYNVINYLKEGHSAYDYYNRYKVNKKRCGRNKTSLTQNVKASALRCVLVTKGYTQRENHPLLGVVIIIFSLHITL